uniref:Uncharacterized protein, isoform A n=2 Tax=Drosophila melanogaster TaxID=7227 RepID=Q9VPM2_DROME|nr:uncharacterized protein Dmel_CG17075, isoform B [Drosophila melanogaster]NP_608508.1 uncharacterized protein Dmel_CG17075, isoform A [Drosophila melanogaster]AAF51524.1 uncharacterized protein Dmel_CG17075, isoform A [Drosophila melanogaster]AFH03498.1 uncharacterized protein Dmel_CG17075, isoform B [Drosophila melanogaster]|eukprot:NP_001245821.1 uncharacterized protein Dmel_CG17075, isoform B [Drosophila melanogaster]
MSTTAAGLKSGPKGAYGVRSETDHIITISTAGLTESHSESPAKGVVTPVRKPHSLGSEDSPENIIPGEQAETNKKPLHLCRLSQLVSYQSNIADVQHRKGRRLHGLQLPLHPLQIFGWLVLLLFGVASYWVLIPAFHARIQGPLYGLITGLYLVHIASHLTALLTDPADKELRRVHRNDRIVPEFDRSKHSHVIENGRCHLCNIRTSSNRTKHCSVCNKCVGKFDHHCKWLNHCIGSRNYVAFLMCVVSAVVATLVIVAAVVAQIVFYYIQPDWLSFYWCPTESSHTIESGDFINITLSLSNGTMMLIEQHTSEEDVHQEMWDEEQANMTISTLPTLLENFTAIIEASATRPGISPTNHTETQPVVTGIGLNETIFMFLLGVLGLLAAVSAGLLLHLCFFHIYISFLGLTTYEYIRNHRQAQDAKTKQLLEGAPGVRAPKNGNVHFSASLPEPHNPSKSLPGGQQLYCCSSAPHPSQHSQESVGQTEQSLRLHCCASSREFHQSGQAIYVCSLLEEAVPQIQVEPDTLSSFHCCSSFAASSLQRRVSLAKGSLISAEPRHLRPATYLQYTEQCTLCTFRLRRGSGPGTGSSGAVSSAGGSSSTRTLTSQTGGSSASATAAGNISKHQRWRRKWNCCAAVPDSPDLPNDLLAALTFRESEEAAAAAKLNAQELPIQFIRTLNGGLDQELPLKATTATPTPPRSSRLRYMLRLLGRYRRPRCRHGAHHGIAAKEHQNIGGSAIKQNQIRPLQLQAAGRGYANSTATPTPPASSPSRSSLESSDLSTSTSPSCGKKELMLLPTSVIRDDSVTTYTLTLPPALPPPTRRKMNQTTQELAELAETLGFASNLQHSQHNSQTNSRTLPSFGNVYRRQRRKHFLRTRSPTLSPIHESGLSNPTSPQPLRHHHQNLANSNSNPAKAMSSPMLNRNSGSANSSALLVQNLCSLAGETLRNSASNSSLQSLSSNSSST